MIERIQKRAGRSGCWHGGAGWTRTSDNAIMSRALYHLSYGTSSAGRLESYREAAARALSFRFLSRRLASATRFLLFRSVSRMQIGAERTRLQVMVRVAEVGFEPTTFGL